MNNSFVHESEQKRVFLVTKNEWKNLYILTQPDIEMLTWQTNLKISVFAYSSRRGLERHQLPRGIVKMAI